MGNFEIVVTITQKAENGVATGIVENSLGGLKVKYYPHVGFLFNANTNSGNATISGEIADIANAKVVVGMCDGAGLTGVFGINSAKTNIQCDIKVTITSAVTYYFNLVAFFT